MYAGRRAVLSLPIKLTRRWGRRTSQTKVQQRTCDEAPHFAFGDMVRASIVCVLAFLDTVSLSHGFSLSETIGSNMVLQRAPARAHLWGWGTPGEKIMLQSSGITTVVGADARWSLIMAPHAAGPAFGNGDLTLSSKETSVTLQNVLFGEVWLCTGQVLNTSRACARACRSHSGVCAVKHGSSLGWRRQEPTRQPRRPSASSCVMEW